MKTEITTFIIDGNSKTKDNLDKIAAMRKVLGPLIPKEVLLQYLLATDGDIEMAINHFLEKAPKEVPKDEVTQIEKIIMDLTEEVKCSICYDIMQDPRTLSCGHSLCGPCLEKMIKHSQEAADDCTIRCPLCMAKHDLKSKCTQNFSIAHITEKLKKIKLSQICADCQSEKSSYFCDYCEILVCKNCTAESHAEHENREQPYVVPFSIEKITCQHLLENWLRELWFAPKDLLAQAQLCNFKCVYVPFWLFHLDGVSNYSCMVNLANSLGGTWLRSGTLEASSLLLCAIDGEMSQFIEDIGPWELDKMERMTSRHRNKIEKELPSDTSPDSLWEEKGIKVLEKKARETCQERILKECRNSKMYDFKVDLKVNRVGQKKVFLPMYYAKYSYSGEEYCFFVNGSTAKTSGTRPRCLVKALTMAAVGVGAVGLLLSARR